METMNRTVSHASLLGMVPSSALQRRMLLSHHNLVDHARLHGVAAYAAAVELAEPSVRSGQALHLSQVSRSTKEGEVSSAPDLGFPRNLEEKFKWSDELGKGGNGIVRKVVNRETGEVYACKSIYKVLKQASDVKKAGHLDSIMREVQVMTILRGSLSVAKLEAVYEDDEFVHIIMELCQGGELAHAIGDRHYSERTVASIMRSVLRTLAQFHSHHILHRDIKPGNFMLLTKDDRSPIKAIDFGLAVPYNPEQLPRTDLGLEGTPWYMAPETLSSEVLPASDIWAAGIMAYQLLSGRFPYDDRRNPNNPSISAIWKSVLLDPLDFNKAFWADISDEAKDFVRMLLARNPAERPTAKEALGHPWLRGDSSERSTGRRLASTVVQRIQRFAQASPFKRTVLQAIAEELVSGACFESQSGSNSRSGSTHGPSCSIAQHQIASSVENRLKGLDLDMDLEATIGAKKLEQVLTRGGVRLLPGEVETLVEQLSLQHDTSSGGSTDGGEEAPIGAFVASQLDWRTLQANHKELWLAAARRAFSELDQDADGMLWVDDIVAKLREKLPEDELNLAVQLAFQESGWRGALDGLPDRDSGGSQPLGIDFEGFLAMLRVGSLDSLDLYDDRLSSRSSPANSTHGGSSNALASLVAAARASRQAGGSYEDSTHHSNSSNGTNHLQFHLDLSKHNGNAAANFFRFETPKAAASPKVAPASFFRFDSPATKPTLALEVTPEDAPTGLTEQLNKLEQNSHDGGFEHPLESHRPHCLEASLHAPSAAPHSVGAASASVHSGASTPGLAGGAFGQGAGCDQRTHGASLYKNAVMRGPGVSGSARMVGRCYAVAPSPSKRSAMLL